MGVHITNVTKQFLPEKTYKIAERGVLDIPGKACLKTYLVVGKYSKTGTIENFDIQKPLQQQQQIVKKSEKHNNKWKGFKLL
jgi:hypothetical protein